MPVAVHPQPRSPAGHTEHTPAVQMSGLAQAVAPLEQVQASDAGSSGASTQRSLTQWLHPAHAPSLHEQPPDPS